MAAVNARLQARGAWDLATKQHGVIALFQLLALGYTEAAVRHRIAKGRLHAVYPGVYAVGLVTAAVVGYAAIALLLRFLRGNPLYAFVAYRIVLGVTVLALAAAGAL